MTSKPANQEPGPYTRPGLKTILNSLDQAPISPEALKRLRLTASHTIEEAAGAVRVGRVTWWKWEKGLRDMPAGLTELYILKLMMSWK